MVQCKQDGSYEEVQCSGSTGYCWCVDKNGTELAGSKTRGPIQCPILGQYPTGSRFQFTGHEQARYKKKLQKEDINKVFNPMNLAKPKPTQSPH